MTHGNRSTALSTAAVFCDTDGRWVLAMRREDDPSETIVEHDLGIYRPDGYIYADRGMRSEWQVCDGASTRGNTLTWPGGKVLSYKPATNRMGQQFSVPQYEPLPDAAVLRWLGRACRARTYASRESYQRHFVGA